LGREWGFGLEFFADRDAGAEEAGWKPALQIKSGVGGVAKSW